MMVPLERTILKHLFTNREYAQTVFPHCREEFFSSNQTATLYRHIHRFFDQYQQLPTPRVVEIELDQDTGLSDRELTELRAALTEVVAEPSLSTDQYAWLLESTESYCQERALYVALRKSVALLDDPKHTPHVIPEMLRDALAVGFTTSVGHDFLGDAEARYDFYHRAESRIPFDLDIFNMMTKNGLPKKTLNVVLAGTNVGKSLFLVHMASACLRMSKNVLYITLEMAEERIAERIDANMMNIPMDDVVMMSRPQYLRKIDALRQTSTGRIIIKEYPTGAAHVGHFRALLQELRTKQSFTPDIIFIDYLSICASSRVKMGSSVNSYTYNKSIAEELRGFAVENDVPIFTASQFNRDGSSSTDPGLDKISESFAIAQTADFIVALVTSEELEKNSQLQCYTLKNRYGKRQSYMKFLLGVDTSRMKLYETANTNPLSLTTPALTTDDFASAFSPKPGARRTRRLFSDLNTEQDTSTY